jgi:hypothetical protein
MRHDERGGGNKTLLEQLKAENAELRNRAEDIPANWSERSADAVPKWRIGSVPARITVITACVLGLLAATGVFQPIRAERWRVCGVVLNTPDGFAVVRAGPSASARLVMRVRSGATVAIVDRSGEWIRVIGDGELGEHGDHVPTWIMARHLHIRAC